MAFKMGAHASHLYDVLLGRTDDWHATETNSTGKLGTGSKNKNKDKTKTIPGGGIPVQLSPPKPCKPVQKRHCCWVTCHGANFQRRWRRSQQKTFLLGSTLKENPQKQSEPKVAPAGSEEAGAWLAHSAHFLGAQRKLEVLTRSEAGREPEDGPHLV